LSLLFLLACVHLEPPPRAPVPPIVQAPADLEPFDIPLQLPAASRQDRFAVDDAGSLVPLDPRTPLAVVLPSDAVRMPGCPVVVCIADVRATVLQTLIDRGFHVRDAGVSAAGADLQAGVSDATSRWGPALAKSLGADHVLRVLTVSIDPLDLPASEALELTREQLALFNASAATWNRDLQRWNVRRDKAVRETQRWREVWDTYAVAHTDWHLQNRRAIQRYRIDATPAQRGPAPVIPDAPPPASTDTLRELLASHPGVIRRLVGTLAAEVVNAKTGEVVWVTRTRGEIAAGPDAPATLARRLLEAALDDVAETQARER
ncbi:MAG: hypothetical protein KC656_14390, partial [Myxococcales bacterium]|nr:hypothetical protein [Myxococcales bacterium]